LYDETPAQAVARWQQESQELAALRTANNYHSTQKEIRTMTDTDANPIFNMEFLADDATDARLIPPDPYRAGIEKLRAAQNITITPLEDNDDRLRAMAQRRTEFFEYASASRVAAAQPAISRTHLEAPDGYALALQRRKEEQR
jgi:hypothetical protein